MGQGFLIDTNVVIDYTSNLLPENGSVFVEQIFNTNFITSVIVKIEVLGYNEPAPEKNAITYGIYGYRNGFTFR